MEISRERLVIFFCQPHLCGSQMFGGNTNVALWHDLLLSTHNAGPCHAHLTFLGTKDLQDTLHELAPDV